MKRLAFALGIVAAACNAPASDGASTSTGGKADNPIAGEVEDVGERYSYRGDKLSAFPRMYPEIPRGEDHEELINIYHVPGVDEISGNHRVEVFITNGDCGQGLFFVTDTQQLALDADGEQLTFNDGRPKRHFGGVYYVETFSSYNDDECGARDYAPRFVDNKEQFIDFTSEELRQFVQDVFITDEGRVNTAFEPMCIELFTHEDERPCITPESIGDIGA